MGILNITEFDRQPIDISGRLLITGTLPPVASQDVTTSGTSAASNAVAETTRFVRIVATANSYIRVGAAPVAVPGDTYLTAGCAEHFGVAGGTKIAAIEA